MKKPMITQVRAAGILNCSQTSVSKWQQGNVPSNKNIDKIKKIIQYLKVLTRQSANKQGKCEEIRRKFGVTPAKVALFLDVTSSTIYRWEKGEIPKSKNLTQINQGVKFMKSILSAECNSTKAT